MPNVPTSGGISVQPEPALANDAAWVPNGRFYKDNLGLMIHTVVAGQLRGKRIIKRRISNDGRVIFKGFAFLMNDGTLRLWQSFRQDAELPYVREAKWLLEFWRHPGNEPDYTRLPEPDDTLSGWLVTHKCRACNMNITVPPTAEGRLCRFIPTAHAHCSAINSLTRAHAPVLEDEDEDEEDPLYVPPRTRRRRVPVSPSSATPLPPPTRFRLDLDELGQGEIR